jgi:hypothetical protein
LAKTGGIPRYKPTPVAATPPMNLRRERNLNNIKNKIFLILN